MAISRKRTVSGVRNEVKDVLERLERVSGASMAEEKERWQAITAFKDEAVVDTALALV